MIELADVISDLRAELDRARLAADGSALRFGLGPVKLSENYRCVGSRGPGRREGAVLGCRGRRRRQDCVDVHAAYQAGLEPDAGCPW